MVQTDAGDHRYQRGEHIGGIEPAAQADLDHSHIEARAGKGAKRQDGHHLKRGEPEPGRFHPRANGGNAVNHLLLADVPGAKADTLTEIDQVGRGEQADLVAGGAEHSMQQRRG